MTKLTKELLDKELDKLWSKKSKFKDEYERGHSEGWNDCINELVGWMEDLE